MDERMSSRLVRWYQRNRRDLPWRETTDPYFIWISEIMLQQTRVETVKEYYRRFLRRFPTVRALAEAPEEDVLKCWEGLGYYSRARNLQKAARTVVGELGGVFPSTYEGLLKLSGIGPYTAGAIASIAFGQAVPAVDGNVNRVASRYFGVREEITSPGAQREIRARLSENMPVEQPGDFNQALMELGATLCAPGAPRCAECPLGADCDACREGDAELLPVHERKAAPKELELAVCLLTFDGSVLVCRRSERMLRGLYVFLLLEDAPAPETVREALAAHALSVGSVRPLCLAKHVFTHCVWNMTIYHCPLTAAPSAQALEALGARMADATELDALPFPTAMKTAKKEALDLL